MKLPLFVSALLFSVPAASHDHSEHAANLGQVTFANTCSARVQGDFLRALALLHSFEYQEAEDAFNQVAADDPTCGIARWGVAMSLYHPLWAPPSAAQLARGREALAEAGAMPAKSQRERDYIEAISTFYSKSETLGHKPRAEAYHHAMRALHAHYPDDREAAVFYALSEIATGTLDDDPTFAREKDAAKILNEVLAAEPNHPGVTHYLIHTFDYPGLADLAVPAARNYAGIAPASPHAQHMPSHIFTRLGMWDESIASNLKSAAAARELMKRRGFDGASREELHALDYLAYAYIQTGQDAAAEEVRNRLYSLQKVDDPNFSVAYAATDIPARLVLERGLWKEAASLELPINVLGLVPLSNFQWGEAHIHFARALGAARVGDQASAQREIAKLEQIERTMTVPPGTYDWRTQVRIQRGIASAWLAKLQGKNEIALQEMRVAADLDDATEKHPVTPGALLPAREQLGELLLQSNRPAEALLALEASLQRAPRRRATLRDLVEAAKRLRDDARVRRYSIALRELSTGGA